VADHCARRATLRALASVLLLACSAATSAEAVHARVVKVFDGDTLAIIDGSNRQFKVRLTGIDAPERGQRYSGTARKSLAELTQSRTVLVEYHKVDRYGRLVGKVSVDGRDVSVEQLRRGLAWHRASIPHDQSHQEAFLYGQAESEARSRRLGLWQENAVPPWKFREANKGGPQ